MAGQNKKPNPPKHYFDQRGGQNMRKSLTMMLSFLSALIFMAFFGSLPVSADTEYPKPPPADAKTLARGKKMYNYVCAPCHGKSGRGDGPVSATVRVKPRDFTRGLFKFRSTASGQLPTVEDLYQSIISGFHTTAMPTFQHLKPEDIYAIARYIMTFSPRFNDDSEYPLTIIDIPEPIPLTTESLRIGRKLYVKMQCHKCHGVSGRGDGPSAANLKDEWGNRLYMPDFPAGKVKRVKSPTDIYKLLATGMVGGSMPSFRSAMTPEELWHLSNYVYGLMTGQSMAAVDELNLPQDKDQE